MTMHATLSVATSGCQLLVNHRLDGSVDGLGALHDRPVSDVDFHACFAQIGNSLLEAAAELGASVRPESFEDLLGWHPAPLSTILPDHRRRPADNPADLRSR
ncbi:hypothetical protein [Bosea sp. NPDC055594]